MRWSRNLSYAIGLIATDGNLSKDGRHIIMTSKDIDQITNFIQALNITNNKIGLKSGSFAPNNKYYHVQFSDVVFYKFLLRIGLFPNKSKTLGRLRIPRRYFADFLRGCFDGDGCTYSYFDPRWKSSFMLYTSFTSGSRKHLMWLQEEINKLYKIKGRIGAQGRSVYNLRFAKYHSLLLLSELYRGRNSIYLSRKRLKIDRALSIINQKAEVEESEDSLP